jgi:hypothetical protein
MAVGEAPLLDLDWTLAAPFSEGRWTVMCRSSRHRCVCTREVNREGRSDRTG